MNQERSRNPTAERTVALTLNSGFYKKLAEIITGENVKQIKVLQDHPLEIERELDHKTPTLIVVDAMLEHSQEAWKNVMNWPFGKEIELQDKDFFVLPHCVQAVSRLSGFRSKGGWKNCLIIVVLHEEKKDYSTQLCLLLGADWVLSRANWHKKLPDALNQLRDKRRFPDLDITQRKLETLVAENTVEVFLLLNILLEDFCNMEMSLDNHGQSLRESRKLSAESIVRDFMEGSYDAVIVDMALSTRQEDFAERYQYTQESDSLASHKAKELRGIVNDNLEGLVAVKHLREINSDVPICVFSNYVGHPGFFKVMQRYWGTRIFESISIFPKSPDGRSQLREWLKRHHGSYTMPVVNKT